MLKLTIALIALLLSGCAELANLLGESDPTFTLSPYPQSSGCARAECQRLDAVEARGYELARSGRITWVRLVDTFYAERDKLFPNAQEDGGTREYRAYQRALAEQLDRKRITESQWAYLLEKKMGELNARSQMLQNTRPRQQTCVTEKTGLPPFETYQTRCN